MPFSLPQQHDTRHIPLVYERLVHIFKYIKKNIGHRYHH